ncbi:MAG: hypothetical protein MUF49_04070 [Oculatellaceae cyanobacterium Prado106]|jgi:hypothetical protein|nr:hypothetical protein [Oculatellaceae cyanobacterium Prado106]
MAKRALRQVIEIDQGKTSKSKTTKGRRGGNVPRCGLCGKTENLTKTDCCGNWICDDEDNYVMFSFAHTSCNRNHRRYALCGIHDMEDHVGRWQDCQECRELYKTEMYVYFGTNEYNFEKLANPPKYEPTHCNSCNRVIRLGYEGYSMGPEGYSCQKCMNKKFGR